ncbi:Protein of unknown function [Cotesia congregata]|uniref:Uncharacterized protein n=1 Tax=Cotesia congregata TaxID=51543 RepID=A0A8J2MP94_COTCN|nr:Protein of unknown function [Cotesia congregata]
MHPVAKKNYLNNKPYEKFAPRFFNRQQRGKISVDLSDKSSTLLTHEACKDSWSAWSGVLSTPPVTSPSMTNLNQEPLAHSTISNDLGSIVNPVSSSTSRFTAAISDSFGWTLPAGKYHFPAQDAFAS